MWNLRRWGSAEALNFAPRAPGSAYGGTGRRASCTHAKTLQCVWVRGCHWSSKCQSSSHANRHLCECHRRLGCQRSVSAKWTRISLKVRSVWGSCQGSAVSSQRSKSVESDRCPRGPRVRECQVAEKSIGGLPVSISAQQWPEARGGRGCYSTRREREFDLAT